MSRPVCRLSVAPRPGGQQLRSDGDRACGPTRPAAAPTGGRASDVPRIIVHLADNSGPVGRPREPELEPAGSHLAPAPVAGAGAGSAPASGCGSGAGWDSGSGGGRGRSSGSGAGSASGWRSGGSLPPAASGGGWDEEPQAGAALLSPAPADCRRKSCGGGSEWRPPTAEAAPRTRKRAVLFQLPATVGRADSRVRQSPPRGRRHSDIVEYRSPEGHISPVGGRRQTATDVASRRASGVTSRASDVTRRVSDVTRRRTSDVTRHTSDVTRHTSDVTCRRASDVTPPAVGRKRDMELVVSDLRNGNVTAPSARLLEPAAQRAPPAGRVRCLLRRLDAPPVSVLSDRSRRVTIQFHREHCLLLPPHGAGRARSKSMSAMVYADHAGGEGIVCKTHDILRLQKSFEKTEGLAASCSASGGGCKTLSDGTSASDGSVVSWEGSDVMINVCALGKALEDYLHVCYDFTTD